MPLASIHRVFGTSTRSSGLATPQMNVSPPEGVHGAGDCAVATAAAPAATASVAAMSMCFMGRVPRINDETRHDGGSAVSDSVGRVLFFGPAVTGRSQHPTI